MAFHDDEDGDAGRAVRIIEERPPLRDGKIFVDYGERAAISENLEAAYAALGEAFRGIWIEKALERGQIREYWDEDDIAALESLTFTAAEAIGRVEEALSSVTDAHYDQQAKADEQAEQESHTGEW